MTAQIDARKSEFEKRLAFLTLDESAGAAWENAVIEQAIKFAADNAGDDGTFCSDDIRPLLPDVHPNRIGRGFSLATERAVIEVVGMRKSAVVSSHARRVLTYRKATTPATVVR